jgi:hypothetical protein
MAMGRRKSITVAVLLLLLGGLICFGYVLYHDLYVTIPDAYAVWNTATLVNDYMDAHDGTWPRGWDDLRRTYEASNRPNPPNPEHMADLRARVAVDWGADPRLLRAARPNGDKPPFKVIWLRDGGSAYWSGAEPNTLVWEHLQHPPDVAQTRPASNPSGAD